MAHWYSNVRIAKKQKKKKTKKDNNGKEFDKDIAKSFQNAYKFCDGDVNKLFLMLQKDVYPHEYMDSWQRFNETSLPEKKEF